MVSLTKTGKGCYLASLPIDIEDLNRDNSLLIKKKLFPFISPHREITIDMNGVKTISHGAYRIIGEMQNKAKTKKCAIMFINTLPSLSAQLLRKAN